MKKTSVLTVVAITEDKDKNGRTYRNIVVQTSSVISVDTESGPMSVKVKPRQSSFNAWEESYLEGTVGSDFGYDLTVGDAIAGTIVTRKVLTTKRDSERNILGYEKTYTIENEGRASTITDEYSAVVLGDTADEQGFETSIRKAFRRADHPLVDDPSVTKLAVLADPAPADKVAELVK